MAKKGKKLFSFFSFDNELSCTTRQSFEKLIRRVGRVSRGEIRVLNSAVLFESERVD